MNQASGKPLAAAGLNFETIYQGVSQKVAYTGTQGQSAHLQARTSVVRLVATTNCHVEIGLTTDNSAAGPTALANGTSMYLPLGVPMIVGVPPGSIGQIAVIQDSAGGNLFITEGA